MIKWARADRERICALIKAVFCRNTLCTARKTDKIRAIIIRKLPKSIYSAFTLCLKNECSYKIVRIVYQKLLNRMSLGIDYYKKVCYNYNKFSLRFAG